MAHAAAQPYHDYHDYSYDMRPLPYPAPPAGLHSPVGRLHSSHPPPGLHPSYYLEPHPHQPPSGSVTHLSHGQHNINTLFVSGLPDDVKAREIHNLFSRHHGFDSCQLKYTGKGDQVVAFATFTTHHSAMAALGVLDRTVFDPETGATLHIELARSNSRKRPRGGPPYMIIDKRTRVKKDETWIHDGDVGSDEPSETENDNSRNKGAITATQSHKEDTKPANGRADQDTENFRPCSTLFLANLGPNCTEADLKQVLSKFSGFQTLKMKGRSGKPVAFADFEDVESSTAALKSLQGTTMGSSDQGEIHIEYARSKMRKS